MPTSYTSLLGLALPVTGELSGTWGDTVNDFITQYVDAAVEGTQTISGSQTAVTLSTANGTSLSQAGTGATGSAQYAIINCTGNPASTLTITAPASSRKYIIINSTSTNQSVKIVASGPTTGVTITAGQRAMVAWNGSDFVQVGGGGGLSYVAKSANYTAQNNEGVLTNTSGGAFTVTLPASPLVGAQVVVADSNSTWGTNNLTVGRNGSTIGGLAQDLICDVAGASVQLVYDGTTWNVFAQVGGNGGTAVTISGTQTLTNKTISADSNTLSGIAASSFVLSNASGNIDGSAAQKAIPAGDVVGTSDSQTLTNKTINGSNNTISNINLASQVTGTLPVANGGTGATVAATARTNLGATTAGGNFFTLTNPSAVTFPRINADNTVSALDAATFRSAIGAGTGGGTVTSVGGTGTVNGITLSGTVTSSGNLTLGGSLSGVSLTSQVSGTLPAANGGTGLTSPGSNGNVLTSNGSAWVSSAPSSGAMVFLNTSTASSVATHDITSGFSTTYNNYMIIVQNVTTANTGSFNLAVRYYIAGTLIDTSVYYTSYVTGASSTAFSNDNRMYLGNGTIESSLPGAFIIWVLNTQNNTSVKQILFHSAQTRQTNLIGQCGTMGGATFTDTGNVTGVRFVIANSNNPSTFSAVFRLYGIAT